MGKKLQRKDDSTVTSRTDLYKRPSARRHLLMIGAIYVIAVYITYLLAGLGLIWFQGLLIKNGFAVYLGIVVGLVLLAFGFLEIKDFFWYGRGFSLTIPARFSNTIKRHATKVTSVGAVLLGIFVAMVELPCTGGPYLFITALLATRFDALAFNYLLIYNVIFVMPLIIIVLLAAFGTNYSAMKAWKESNKKWMRLLAGILLICFGIFIILYYLGYVNLEYIGLHTGGTGALTMDTLTLPLVLGTAAVDSINPCAIGVLLLLMATLVSMSRAQRVEINEGIE